MYIPPKSEDAEIATLGSVIIDGNVMEYLQDLLEPEDYYSTKHKKIFSTMLGMQSRGISIDIVTMSDELSSRGWLEEVGGCLYLTHLHELTPSSANAEQYAKIVKEYSNQRKLSEKLIAILTDIKDNKIDYAGAAAQVEEIDIGYSGKSNLVPISAKDLGEDTVVEALWGDLFFPACITQINSEPGVGKTTFALNIAINGCKGSEFLDVPFSKKP